MEDGFVKENVQKFGKFLSAMVMPNIGALIAFGFLAALFIDTGWIPNKGFNSLVSPMLTYLIPILIASTGGRILHQEVFHWYRSLSSLPKYCS